MINYIITFENTDAPYLITSKHSIDDAQGYINLTREINAAVANKNFCTLEIETINKLYKL